MLDALLSLDPKLISSILIGLSTLFGVIGLSILFRQYQSGQKSLNRLREISLDQDEETNSLNNVRPTMRWALRYDMSDAAKPIQAKLLRAQIRIKPSEYQVFRFAIGFLLLYLNQFIFKLDWRIMILVALVIARFLPPMILWLRKDKYYASFNFQLIEATATMASSIRAGQSMQQAIEKVAQNAPMPSKQEFRQLSREINMLGVATETALEKLLLRLPSEELTILVATIAVQRQAGGNLVKALAQLSDVMRERKRIREEIHTMTAEVRYSAYIIIALPLVILLILNRLMPEMIGQIFVNPIGWLALAIFAVLQIIGFLLIRRVADIKV